MAKIALFLTMLVLAFALGCSESDSSEEVRRAAVVTALDNLAADLLEDRPPDAAAYTERLQIYLEAHPSFFGSAAAILDRPGESSQAPTSIARPMATPIQTLPHPPMTSRRRTGSQLPSPRMRAYGQTPILTRAAVRSG